MFEIWLKGRSPWVHRFIRPIADWLSRPQLHAAPRSVRFSGLVVLILVMAVFWLGR